MFEFFKGWRRKAGCILLVIASVLAGAWVRSYYALDFCEGPYQGREQTFASLHGYLTWRSWDKDPRYPRTPWQTLSANAINIDSWLALSSDDNVKSRARQWALPYSWIVLPPTLLCSRLLLWPQQKRLLNRENVASSYPSK